MNRRIKVFFLLIFPFSLFSLEKEPPRKTICLNMIVKNEKEVIQRCLNSVLPLIDTWVIVDTGSTDGTQEQIRSFLKNVPGELHQRPWVDFGHNRNEALSLAKGKADYILFMDADDVLSFDPSFKLPCLERDFYTIYSNDGMQKTALPRLIKSSLPWKWHGTIHEYIAAEFDTQGSFLEGVEYVYLHDGARSKDPESLKKDLALLEKDPTNPRNVFYSLMTYLRLEEYEKALEACEKRVRMGGWEEETFTAQLMKGRIEKLLQKSSVQVKESLMKAYQMRPSRLEPLYYFAELLWEEKEFTKGYQLLELALHLPKNSEDALFVDSSIGEFGLKIQKMLFAAQLGHYQESLRLSQELLQHPQLPEREKQRVLECSHYVESKLLSEAQKKIPEILFKMVDSK